MRTALFLVITQRVVVISYRRFGTTYLEHWGWERTFVPKLRQEITRLSRNAGEKL